MSKPKTITTTLTRSQMNDMHPMVERLRIDEESGEIGALMAQPIIADCALQVVYIKKKWADRFNALLREMNKEEKSERIT